MKQQIRKMLMREQKRARLELARVESFKRIMQGLGVWEEVKKQLISQNKNENN